MFPSELSAYFFNMISFFNWLFSSFSVFFIGTQVLLIWLESSLPLELESSRVICSQWLESNHLPLGTRVESPKRWLKSDSSWVIDSSRYNYRYMSVHGRNALENYCMVLWSIIPLYLQKILFCSLIKLFDIHCNYHIY